MEKQLTIRVPKRLLKAALILTIVGAVIAPIAVSASHQFTDVPTTHIFHDNIGWLADNDVTKGCNPPTNDRYCPDDNVTRGQMAAFMQRLSEGKIVDAATAEEADHAATADSATTAATAATAGDSDTVDGLDANELTRVAYEVATFSAFTGDGATNGDILSTSITAPVDGFLIISASSDVFFYSTDSGTLGCGLELDGATVASATRQIELNGGTAVNQEEDCDTETVVPVMAGDHTVAFVTRFTPASGVVFDESTLWALFVPFDGAGNTPTDFTVTGLGSEAASN